MANQITIGRNPQSTIVVDAKYNTVSGNHATITRNGNTLTIEDHSTNGTYVNGVKCHNGSVQIHMGDSVTLGQQYPLNISEVMSLLGGPAATQRMVTPATARVPQPDAHQQNVNVQINVGGANSNRSHEEVSSYRETPKCLNDWSWGAFVWGWLWGVCNGVYWPLITLIPYVGQLAALIICFILGANGNRYAWEKFSGSAAEFDEKQHNWAVAAGVYAVILVLLIVIFVIAIIAES